MRMRLKALKPFVGTLAGATVLLALVSLAHAITINNATLSPETVTISGNKAAKSATISWEGAPVTTSTKGGTFSFTTAVVPADCIGTLTDGVSTVEIAIAGCTVTPPPPTTGFPATGQTTCWDSDGNVVNCAGTGQDGEIQAGAALSYADNGDGTITDNNTGLMWAKKGDDDSIHDKDNLYTWSDAFAVHIAGLNTANFAGFSDWRLPNVKELQSIVNYGNVPAVSPEFNTSCAAGVSVEAGSCTALSVYYWSSSSYVFTPANAWIVQFSDGNVTATDKSDTLHVRAVRGGS